MSPILVPALYVMSGVCAFSALQHGLAALRRRVSRDHLLFALMSLQIMGFVMAKAGAYGAQTVDILVTMRRWEIAFACGFFPLLLWFVADYTGIRPRKMLAWLSAFFALMFTVNLILPYGIQFIDLPSLTYFTLPWGERVVDLRVLQRGFWHKLTWAGVFAVMGYCIYACSVQYRRGGRQRARLLAWALGLFFVPVLFNVAVNLGLVEFVHTGEFGFVAMIVFMDLVIGLESRDQSRRMRAVLDHLPVAVCLKDLQGRYQMVNRGFETFFHVNTPILDKTDFDLFSREQAERFHANEHLALDTCTKVESEDVLEWNGKSHIFRSHQFPLLRPDGSPYGVCGVCIDITESRQQDEMLHKFRRQVWHTDRVTSTSALTASLAHELCQPLSAILNNAQAGLRFLAQDGVDLGEIREILQDIVRDDKRAGAVINGLRTMLQQQETPYADIDLSQCIEEVIGLLHSEFLRCGTEIERTLETNLTVRVNKTQIQQVMLNLILNALEAMMEQPAGERVLRVNLTRTDGKALVSIRDNGIGIPEEMLNRVFEGFYTTKPQGLGMGLEVCRSIIESHHGAIWAETNSGGGGGGGPHYTLTWCLP
ncbi:MAG: ATP-binding protein, partial [Sulfurimicrobium sp.]|nr:ATP-binding protein [Sulfurimicrobium sp.]